MTNKEISKEVYEALMSPQKYEVKREDGKIIITDKRSKK